VAAPPVGLNALCQNWKKNPVIDHLPSVFCGIRVQSEGQYSKPAISPLVEAQGKMKRTWFT
jgi:hypothetical protein